MGLSIFPPFLEIYKKKFNFEISSGLKIVIVIIGFFLILFFTIGNSLDNSSYNSNNNNYHEEYLEYKESLKKSSENSSINAIHSSELIQKNIESELEDIFESQKYKKYINSNDDKLDCNLKSNHGKERIYFKVHYRCRLGEDSTISVDDDECEMFGGTLTPNIVSKSYPSLNEYHFSYVVFELINYGCTKITDKDYKIVYVLYQNGNLIKSKTDEKTMGNMINMKEGALYPEDFFFVHPNFQDAGKYGNPIILTNPDNLIFKSCIVSGEENKIVICDEINFNLN